MRLLQSSPTAFPLPLAFPKPNTIPLNSVSFSRKPLRFFRRSVPISPCSAPKALPLTEKEILESIVESDGDNEKKSLPGVRVYENDLARLSLIGDVAFEQALTAAAADGGEAADEHIVAGMSTMVIETVFPGPCDERSTVSTRLFLPARKVKEKAGKLRNIFPKDMLSSTTPKNILAMTFRQVVLQRSWSFELVSFGPGAERNMEDLENPREVPAFFTLSTSDERVLSVLAEAVCMLALESTERDFHENSHGTATNNIIDWFREPRRIASKDLSVFIYEISQDEIVANAKELLGNFNMKGGLGLRKTKKNYQWWKTSTYAKLEKIGGPDLITWTNEYVPAYSLQVDVDKLKNLKLEGWKYSAENRWEVLLTHSQMVGLADVLDVYYEDIYTAPDKQFSCGMVVDIANSSKSKRTSFWKVLSITLASGFFLVSITILAQFYWPQLKVWRPCAKHDLVPLSEVDCSKDHALDASELEGVCISIIKKLKDAIGWPGDIVADKDGAWMGEFPSYLRKLDDAGLVKDVVPSNAEDNATDVGHVNTSADLPSAVASPSDKSNSGVKTSGPEIASYQVALSKDGKIIRLHPMSPLAANHWASNPLLQELYNGQLSPGHAEPGLESPQPNELVLIELLMSVNPDSWFALARSVRRSH